MKPENQQPSALRLKTCARRGLAWVAILFLLVPGSNALAQGTLVGSGNPLTKPAKVDSFVVTSNGSRLWDANPGTVANAVSLPMTLNTFAGSSIDILMQQCFGGGFALGMNAVLDNKYTFTSATNWNEEAVTTPGGANFTSSWAQSLQRAEGLYTHYVDVINGAAAIVGPPAFPAVIADPYGPLGASRHGQDFENPVYASPDALATGNPNPNGANNSRDIVPANSYAVLMAPDPLTNGADTPRFGTNIDRVYQSLLNKGVPANHIIVLYGSNAANTKTPGGTPINGPATLVNIQNASNNGTGLYGNVTGQTIPGNPDKNSHLFAYTTGHGGSWDATGATGKASQAANMLAITAKDMPANAFLDANGSDSGIGNLDLQLSSLASDLGLGNISLYLNGILLQGFLAADLQPKNDLTDIIGSMYTYDISVPLSLFDSVWTPGSPLDIALYGLSNADTYDTLISAVSFNDYGDNWAVGVVPEPGTLSLLGLGLAGLSLMRRRTLHRQKN